MFDRRKTWDTTQFFVPSSLSFPILLEETDRRKQKRHESSTYFDRMSEPKGPSIVSAEGRVTRDSPKRKSMEYINEIN